MQADPPAGQYDKQSQQSDTITSTRRELTQTRELLQSVFDTSLIGMALHEAVRDEQGTILDFRIMIVNKELQRITGRADLVGKLYSEEFPGIKLTGLYELMLEVMESGRPGQMEYCYQHDGFDSWFSSMFVKSEDGLVATNIDITKRKQIEAEKLDLLTAQN